MQLPCFTIGAPQGRSGKTIVSLGLCAALRQHGVTVQPFKKGPDYIDPSWLSAASGRNCRNLDNILMPESTLLNSFHHVCQDADLALIEGAMGLFDGFDARGQGSTAHLARLLGSPIILVVNAARMTRSVAAMVNGYMHFEADNRIAGVILNNVSGLRHRKKLTEAIENYCSIPVVGAVSRDANLNIKERHLGLIPFAESNEADSIIEGIRQNVEPGLDIDGILKISRQAASTKTDHFPQPKIEPAAATIGVIRDRVFNFYYPENLEALKLAGAELVFIDSLRDRSLPAIDALYIGGGFPELFLKELEANHQLRQDIAAAVEGYLPVYAECAGLMYLCRSIQWHRESREMVGVIPADVELSPRPQGHGYVLARVSGENPLFPLGLTLWGHEFHHSRLVNVGNVQYAYRLVRGHGINGELDGVVYKNLFAAYTHLHAAGVPQWAACLVSLARKHTNSLVPALKTENF